MTRPGHRATLSEFVAEDSRRTMAVVRGAWVELVEERCGDRVRGLARELMRRAPQELIDAESIETIGAVPMSGP